MKRLVLVIVFVAAAAGLTTLLYFQWREPAQKKRRKRGKRSVVVEVASVKTGPIVARAHYIGTLLPRSQFTVAPQIGGRLSRLKVQIGDRVKPKQLLAHIDNQEVIHQVEQALAAVRVARAQLDEQNARLQIARKVYRRDLALGRKKLISQAQRDKTESSYKIELAKLRVMQAQLSQKRSMLKAARNKLSYTRVYAQWVIRPLSKAKTRELMEGKETLEQPIPNGPGSDSKKKPQTPKKPKKKPKTSKQPPTTSFRVVGERLANEGALVSPNSRLLTLIDIRTVIAVVHATEKDYIELKIGQPAVARTYVYRGRRFVGRVIRIAPLLKESSRLARVELEFVNFDLALKPGMFVRINIDLKRADKATLIPRQALVRQRGKVGVFLVEKNSSSVRFVPVKTGIQQGDTIQVLSPPLSGRVVTLGHHLLRNGSAVTIPGDKRPTRKPGARRRRGGKRR